MHLRKRGAADPKDESAAKSYYEKAAELGNEDAKAALKSAQCRFRIKRQIRELRRQSLLLVSRFRRLYPFAAGTFTSVGRKGTLATLCF